jgi:hypothetical protein
MTKEIREACGSSSYIGFCPGRQTSPPAKYTESKTNNVANAILLFVTSFVLPASTLTRVVFTALSTYALAHVKIDLLQVLSQIFKTLFTGGIGLEHTQHRQGISPTTTQEGKAQGGERQRARSLSPSWGRADDTLSQQDQGRQVHDGSGGEAPWALAASAPTQTHNQPGLEDGQSWGRAVSARTAGQQRLPVRQPHASRADGGGGGNLSISNPRPTLKDPGVGNEQREGQRRQKHVSSSSSSSSGSEGGGDGDTEE